MNTQPPPAPVAAHLALVAGLAAVAALLAALASEGVIPGGADVPLLVLMVGSIVLWAGSPR